MSTSTWLYSQVTDPPPNLPAGLSLVNDLKINMGDIFVVLFRYTPNHKFHWGLAVAKDDEDTTVVELHHAVEAPDYETTGALRYECVDHYLLATSRNSLILARIGTIHLSHLYHASEYGEARQGFVNAVSSSRLMKVHPDDLQQEPRFTCRLYVRNCLRALLEHNYFYSNKKFHPLGRLNEFQRTLIQYGIWANTEGRKIRPYYFELNNEDID